MNEIKKQDQMEDPDDLELKTIMGDRFHDVSKEKKPVKAATEGAGEEKPVPMPCRRKAQPAQWEPVDPWPTQMDRMKYCAKHTLLFGTLCLLVFYWQQTGQMLSSAAVPTMMACCGGAMWHVGRAWK